MHFLFYLILNETHHQRGLVSDAVKRRTLPAWIREGLEKMDREKQKKLERERMEKERAEMKKDDGKEQRAIVEGDGPRLPRKSKFVSLSCIFMPNFSPDSVVLPGRMTGGLLLLLLCHYLCMCEILLSC